MENTQLEVYSLQTLSLKFFHFLKGGFYLLLHLNLDFSGTIR